MFCLKSFQFLNNSQMKNLTRILRKLKIYKPICLLMSLAKQAERDDYFHGQANVHSTTRFLPNATIDNLSKNQDLISIGSHSVIRGQLLIFAHAGKIEIGDNCYIGENSRIWSAASVKIGDRVLIAHNVNIHDTDSHSINPMLRHQHFVEVMSNGHPVSNEFDIKSKPVVIESDVWIGFNSTILKGVTIGTGAIVAACSLVTKDVPPKTIVAGNPARLIRDITDEIL
jgi:acetyltransferase-like isoleucine patch superfamily enzyme